LCVLDYLYMGTDRRGIVRFTIDNMIKQCKFKIRTGEKESVSQFKKILHMLQRESFIQTLFDEEDIAGSPLIESYKLKDLIICSLTIDFANKFVILEKEEKDRIYGYNEEKLSHLKLLLYYCYLKCRMYKRPIGDQMVVSGGRAEIAYPTFEIINKDLGLTDDTIDKYNKILVDLNMIRYKSAGNWYYKDDPNKIVRESCNIYTLFTDEETANLNLKEGIKYYKKLDRNSNKIFTGSKAYKNNNKVLNGELGSIIKKEKKGTATEKDMIRKNELLYWINANDEQHGIRALLDSNPDTLLSDIYYGFNSDEKAEKYYNLEHSLGLLDTGKEFGIDFTYYKWIMMNYDKDEHNKFVHCVDNKKRAGLKIEDVIYFADQTPKHKGFGLQNKKKVIERKPVIFEDMFENDEPYEEEEYIMTEDDIQAMHEIEELNRVMIPDEVLRIIEQQENEEDYDYEDDEDLFS